MKLLICIVSLYLCRGNYIALRDEYIDMQRQHEIASLQSLEEKVRQRKEELKRERELKLSGSMSHLSKGT